MMFVLFLEIEIEIYFIIEHKYFWWIIQLKNQKLNAMNMKSIGPGHVCNTYENIY